MSWQLSGAMKNNSLLLGAKISSMEVCYKIHVGPKCAKSFSLLLCNAGWRSLPPQLLTFLPFSAITQFCTTTISLSSCNLEWKVDYTVVHIVGQIFS